MAENDDEDLLEESFSSDDASDDSEEGDSPKKKGLSKPLLIKIAIGVVVVLILAGAAYFFLASSDEEAVDEADAVEQELSDSEAENSDVEAEPVEDMDNAGGDTIELPELPDEALATSDEDPIGEMTDLPTDIDLPELPDDTEATLTEDINDSAAEPEKKLTIEEEAKALIASEIEVEKKEEAMTALERQKAIDELAAKMRAERYKNVYEAESRPYPWTRKPKTQPLPEPKWGEFDRAYK